MLYDGTSCAVDFKSGDVFIRHSIISERPHGLECVHVICALKHITGMISLYTVNVVIFAGEKLARHFTGGNFHDTTPISFIKAYGFYFRVGVIFSKKTKAQKTRKLPVSENFHV